MDDRLPKLLALHHADPHDADVLYMIALEHTKAQRYEDAVAWLDRTLAQAPGYHYAYFQQAKAYEELGRHDRAKDTLVRGIRRAQEDGNGKAVGELTGLLESLEE